MREVASSSPKPSTHSGLVESAKGALARLRGATFVAEVNDASGACDLAVMLGATPAVVRCAEEINLAHVRALSTMLVQGPFKIAVLVSHQMRTLGPSPVVCCGIDHLYETLANIADARQPWT